MSLYPYSRCICRPFCKNGTVSSRVWSLRRFSFYHRPSCLILDSLVNLYLKIIVLSIFSIQTGRKLFCRCIIRSKRYIIIRLRRGLRTCIGLFGASSLSLLPGRSDEAKVLHRHPVLASLGSILRSPGIEGKPALDKKWAALLQILIDIFRLPGKSPAIHKTGLFLLGTVLACPFPVHGDSEIDDSDLAWGVRKLRVARQISHQQNFVKTAHIRPFLPMCKYFPYGQLIKSARKRPIQKPFNNKSGAAVQSPL